MRTLTYAAAIREAHAQLLESDPRVFVLGQGLWSPWYAGSTLKNLDRDYGTARIIDSPVSENATTAAGIGAAISGMRPIIFHPRMDFMLLAVDPIVNQAANWSYVFNGASSVPVVIRSVINRRGEQGAQHSQALQAMYAHIPGLKVVMPANARDAKGLLIAASRDGNPVMYIDDRVLYEQACEVPEPMYETPIGKAEVIQSGTDVTLIGISCTVPSIRASLKQLEASGIRAEAIDLRSLKPWDRDTVYQSVAKTGRLVIVEESWRTCGFSAEIAASVTEDIFDALRAPIRRITLPDAPAPASQKLERAYYLTEQAIIQGVNSVLETKRSRIAA